jgi:hypothetical protein
LREDSTAEASEGIGEGRLDRCRLASVTIGRSIDRVSRMTVNWKIAGLKLGGGFCFLLMFPTSSSIEHSIGFDDQDRRKADF